MSVVRVSFSLPQHIYKFLQRLTKETNNNQSLCMARLIEKEMKMREMQELSNAYNSLAEDEQHHEESEQFISHVSKNYAKNVLSNESSQG